MTSPTRAAADVLQKFRRDCGMLPTKEAEALDLAIHTLRQTPAPASGEPVAYRLMRADGTPCPAFGKWVAAGYWESAKAITPVLAPGAYYEYAYTHPAPAAVGGEFVVVPESLIQAALNAVVCEGETVDFHITQGFRLDSMEVQVSMVREVVRVILSVAAAAPQPAASGEAHWAFAAADALRPFVNQLMDIGSTSATDRSHLLWMIERMNPKTMSATKACRWLGWIQCALCDQGVMNLPSAKEHNAKFSAATPIPAQAASGGYLRLCIVCEAPTDGSSHCDVCCRADEVAAPVGRVEGEQSEFGHDAARYRWLREQVRRQGTLVTVQGLFWNNTSRKSFDEAVDRCMSGGTIKPITYRDPSQPEGKEGGS